jgi:hypothetical protein
LSRSAQRFRQGDVTKAVKAVTKAGMTVGRVEISADGRITFIAGKPGEGQNSATEANEWDTVK